MRVRWTPVLIVAVTLWSNAAMASEPVRLKVLYAGNPGSERAKDFTSFLEKHFVKVGTTDLRKFSDEAAEGYDAVLIDWTSVYPRDDKGKATGTGQVAELPVPRLSKGYARPTVLIGGAGGNVGLDLRLNIDWMCLCLHDAAHDVVSTHEVFQKPLKVSLTFEERTTPQSYRRWPGGEKLGKTIKTWKVQDRGFPEIDPGLVSDGYGFADAPDCEVIAGGLNEKSPEAVALGRHGNFMLWGFSGQPSDMTPEARKCFVNVVCYIKKFDGEKPIARRTTKARQWALVYAMRLKEMSEPGPFLREQFPADLRERLGQDSQKYVTYYQENIEYLRPSATGFAVDEDAKKLGLSNRKVEILDRCISLLEEEKQQDLATRVLKRYTTESFKEAREWRTWLKENRSKLFFTDTAGFKFLVGPGPKG